MSGPTWSPDGRWVVFSSTGAGNADLWKVDVFGGPTEPLTFSSWLEVAPSWSPDGRWLYFTRDEPDGRRGLWRQRTAGGEAELLVPGLDLRTGADWAVGPSGVYLVSKTPEHTSVLSHLDPEGDESRPVAFLEEWPLSPSLALAPDESWLVYSQVFGVESDILIAEGIF